MIDIVQPKGNEQALADMAKKLGYTQLIYAYVQPPKEKPLIPFPHDVATFGKNGKIRIGQKATELEQGKVQYLTNLELETTHDKTHQRNSGLNHVYAALAKKQKTMYCVNLHSLLTSKEPEKILGRMLQNVRLCQKYQVPVMIASFATTPYELRSPKDLQALGRVLGIRSNY